MNINIRKIEEKDFEKLIALFLEFAIFEKLADAMINTVEQMKKEQDLVNGFVAENKDGDIVGYVTCFFSYHTWSGKSLYMDDLYIKELYRGQGLGTKLINEIISLAKKEDCMKLRWQVSNWNHPAIQFYENLGAIINRVDMNCDLKLK